MVLGSSSDEEPDLAGIISQHQVAQHQQEPAASQDSDLPAWIASHVRARADSWRGPRKPPWPLLCQLGWLCVLIPTPLLVLLSLLLLQTPVRAPISVSSDSDSDDAPLAARWTAGAGVCRARAAQLVCCP
jgi:hypothetical protein